MRESWWFITEQIIFGSSSVILLVLFTLQNLHHARATSAAAAKGRMKMWFQRIGLSLSLMCTVLSVDPHGALRIYSYGLIYQFISSTVTATLFMAVCAAVWVAVSSMQLLIKETTTKSSRSAEPSQVRPISHGNSGKSKGNSQQHHAISSTVGGGSSGSLSRGNNGSGSMMISPSPSTSELPAALPPPRGITVRKVTASPTGGVLLKILCVLTYIFAETTVILKLVYDAHWYLALFLLWLALAFFITMFIFNVAMCRLRYAIQELRSGSSDNTTLSGALRSMAWFQGLGTLLCAIAVAMQLQNGLERLQSGDNIEQSLPDPQGTNWQGALFTFLQVTGTALLLWRGWTPFGERGCCRHASNGRLICCSSTATPVTSMESYQALRHDSEDSAAAGMSPPRVRVVWHPQPYQPQQPKIASTTRSPEG